MQVVERGGEDDGFGFEHGKHAFGIHCNQDVLLRLQVLLIRQEQRIKLSFSRPRPDTPISAANFLGDDSEFL